MYNFPQILMAKDVNIDQFSSYPAVANPIRSIMTRLALSVHSSSSPHGPEEDRQIHVIYTSPRTHKRQFYWHYVLTVVDGICLQTVQLKQPVFDWHVTDEVKCLHRPDGTDAVLFLRQVPRLRSTWKQDKNNDYKTADFDLFA